MDEALRASGLVARADSQRFHTPVTVLTVNSAAESRGADDVRPLGPPRLLGAGLVGLVELIARDGLQREERDHRVRRIVMDAEAQRVRIAHLDGARAVPHGVRGEREAEVGRREVRGETEEKGVVRQPCRVVGEAVDGDGDGVGRAVIERALRRGHL